MTDRAGSTDSFKPRREEDDVEMDITPMIDIVFLLLAFFVVSSKMQEQAKLPIPFAKHGTTVVAKDSVVVSIDQENPEADPIAYLGKDVSPGKGFVFDDDTEEKIITYIQTELNTGKKTNILISGSGLVRNKYMKKLRLYATKAIPEGKEVFIHEAVNEGE